MPTSRRALVALSLAVSAAAAAGLVCRQQPVRTVGGLAIAVVAPYLAALSVLGIGVAVASRRRVLCAVSAILAAAGVGTQVCWYHAARPADPPGQTVLRVLSSNIRNGEADAASLVGLAEQTADVIVVVELTPEAVARMSQAGIGRSFPHSRLIPAPLAGGIGIWSRYPVSPLPLAEHPSATVPAILVRLPGAASDTVVVAVHVKSPLAGGRNTVGDWRGGLTHVKDQLARLANSAGAGSVIVAGDFNATPDVRQFRDLLTGGYRDCVEQLGAGFTATFPADRPYPPLFGIDHILTRNAAALSIGTVRVAGSDHLALLGSVAVSGGHDQITPGG